jgi:hypothetical protein
MALDLLIPRLEWNIVSTSGTTVLGSPTISSIADTSGISVGAYVTGSGIPVGSYVLSKTPSTLVLSNNATASATVAIEAKERFDFQYPPVADSEDEYDVKNIVSISLDGTPQVQTNFVEITRALTFDFLTHTERDSLLRDFFLGWAYLGSEFRFYLDKADALYDTYMLQPGSFKFSNKRRVKKHPYFLYQLMLKFRRVLDNNDIDVLLTESSDPLLTEDGHSISIGFD